MLVLFGSCHHQTVNRNVQDIRYRQHYVSGQDNMQQQHNKYLIIKKNHNKNQNLKPKCNHACKTQCDWLEKNAKWIWVNVPVMIWGFGYVLAPMDGDIYYVRCWLYIVSRFHDLGELHRMIRRQLTRIFILVVHVQPLKKFNFL